MKLRAEESDSRTASKERRRQQLIDATIRSISKRGLGGTTMSEVAKEAGLSQGIVNLHFQSKENLLRETMQFLAREYDEEARATLEKSGPGAHDKLLALMRMDMKPAVCDRQKLAVWFAFWGEAKAMPTYQRIAAELDSDYSRAMLTLCREIIQDGNYCNVSAEQVTNALCAMSDGLWLSRLINPKAWSRAGSLAAIMSYLKAVFPGHYA